MPKNLLRYPSSLFIANLIVMSSLLRKCAASTILSPSAGRKNLAAAFLSGTSSGTFSYPSRNPIRHAALSDTLRVSASCHTSRYSSSLATATIDGHQSAQIHPGVLLFAASSKRSQATNHDGGSPLTRTEIRRMRVADLRDELLRRGLSSSGLREALVARLLDASSSGTNNVAEGIGLDSGIDRSFSSSRQGAMNVSTVQLSPEKTYVLRFDGGSRGNPGIAGAGMVLYDSDEGTEVWSGFHYMGDSHTNNEAEYTGILEGLRCAHAMGARRLVVQGDSQLIIRQLEGKYRVKSERLRPYYQQVMKLLRQFDHHHVCHIERAENARADELANEAMDTCQSSMDM